MLGKEEVTLTFCTNSVSKQLLLISFEHRVPQCVIIQQSQDLFHETLILVFYATLLLILLVALCFNVQTISESLIIGMTLCPKKIPHPIIEIPVIKASYYISIVLKMIKKFLVLYRGSSRYADSSYKDSLYASWYLLVQKIENPRISRTYSIQKIQVTRSAMDTKFA